MNLESLSLGAGEVLLIELSLGQRLLTASLSLQEERKRLQSQESETGSNKCCKITVTERTRNSPARLCFLEGILVSVELGLP